MSSKLLTADEVAERLRVKVARVYELGRIGALPTVRIGRLIRFAEPALDDYIAGGGHTLPGGWRREPREGAGGAS